MMDIKLAALLLAGVLSFQTTQAGPPEMPEAQIQEETEPAEEQLSPMVIYEEWLPLYCTKVPPDDERGSVFTDVAPGHEIYPHTFTIYLPPHYDENEQYDLLIYLGPFQGVPGDCVDKYQSTWYTEIFRFRTVFDNLILHKLVRPFIMIQPDYLQWKETNLSYDAISMSIKEELLPYVAEHFATYAESGDYEDLVAARDHVAMGGCSLGGMHTLMGLMPNCLDVASSFCPMSCNINTISVVEKVEEQAAKYPLKKLIYTVGSMEEFNMLHQPDHLKHMFPELLTDENFLVFTLNGTYHHYSTWAAGLWNSLQLIFRGDEPGGDSPWEKPMPDPTEGAE